MEHGFTEKCIIDFSETPLQLISPNPSPLPESPLKFEPLYYIVGSSASMNLSIAIKKEPPIITQEARQKAIKAILDAINEKLKKLEEATTKLSYVKKQSPPGYNQFHEIAHMVNNSEVFLLIFDSFDSFPAFGSQVPFGEAYEQIILNRYNSFIKSLHSILDRISRLTTHFKRLTAAAIRLQFIANAIQNRISRSPTPQKKEPPIGGIKVGGEQPGSHIAGRLYQLSLLTVKHAAQF